MNEFFLTSVALHFLRFLSLVDNKVQLAKLTLAILGFFGHDDSSFHYTQVKRKVVSGSTDCTEKERERKVQKPEFYSNFGSVKIALKGLQFLHSIWRWYLDLKLGGKMDLTTADIFNQIQELHKASTSQQTHEGITENWRNTSTHQEIYSSPPLINNKACFGNMGSDHHHQPQGGINTKQDGVSVTASLESLDCLLSATTSNTDTSIEDDDGISMIFSDCRALWNNFTNANNNTTSATTVSSGESENNITCNARNKETYDETASQSSSDQAKSLQTKSVVPTKRNYSFMEGGFRLISDTNNPGGKSKRLKQEKQPNSSNINFQQPSSSFSSSIEEPDPEAIAQMKEMIYRAAAFRPVNLGLDVVERPKRKNVRISTDPQTVAARQRRERVSERIRVLQRLVPGGSKMDTASMLDEAANYLKFLRSQVKALENLGQNHSSSPTNIAFSSLPFNHSFPMQHTQFPFLQNPNHLHLP